MSLETEHGKATVVTLCEVFGLSRSAYCAARRALEAERVREPPPSSSPSQRRATEAGRGVPVEALREPGDWHVEGRRCARDAGGCTYAHVVKNEAVAERRMCEVTENGPVRRSPWSSGERGHRGVYAARPARQVQARAGIVA